MASMSATAATAEHSDSLGAMARGTGEVAALRTLISNYFSLGQFQLGRACALQLERHEPGAALQLLASICMEGVPTEWLPSPTVPSAAHLRWACLNLHDSLVEGHQRRLPLQLRHRLEMRLLVELIGLPEQTEPREVLAALPSSLRLRELDLSPARELVCYFWGPLCDLPSVLTPALAARIQCAAPDSPVAVGRGSQQHSGQEAGQDKALLSACTELLKGLAGQQPYLTRALGRLAERLSEASDAAAKKRSSVLAVAFEKTHLAILSEQLSEGQRFGLAGSAGQSHASACHRVASLTGQAGLPEANYGSSFAQLIKRQPAEQQLRAMEAAVATGEPRLSVLMQECIEHEASHPGQPLGTAFTTAHRSTATSSPASCTGGAAGQTDRPHHAATQPVPHPVFALAFSRKVHILETALHSAVEFVASGDLASAAELLQHYQQLRPLVVALCWDSPFTPAWDRPKAGDALKERRALLDLMADGGSSSMSGDCCVAAMCRQLAYRLKVAGVVEQESIEPAAAAKGRVTDNSLLAAASMAATLLAEQSSLSVIAYLLPGYSLEAVLSLVQQQPPVPRSLESNQSHDVQLVRVAMAVCSMLRLYTLLMEADKAEENEDADNGHADQFGSSSLQGPLLLELETLTGHIVALSGTAAGDGEQVLEAQFVCCWTLSILRAVLHMDAQAVLGAASDLTPGSTPTRSKQASGSAAETIDPNGLALHVLSELAAVVRGHLPPLPPMAAQEPVLLQALRVHCVAAAEFCDELEWRLSLMRRMAPAEESAGTANSQIGAEWGWTEVLHVLQASPLTLINMCKKRSQYALGGEAIRHFNLPESEASALQLAEWVDSAAVVASLDLLVSKVNESGLDGSGGEQLSDRVLDFGALKFQLPTMQQVMLCLDVAGAIATSPLISQRLLAQAQSLIPESESPRQGNAAEADLGKEEMWGTIAFVARRMQALSAACEQRRPLQAEIAGVDEQEPRSTEDVAPGRDRLRSSGGAVAARQWQRRMRAIQQIAEAQAGFKHGRHQFLSGLLHNIAQALADEALLTEHTDALEAVGFSPGLASTDGEEVGHLPSRASSHMQEPGPVSISYLAAMISYLAQVGDEMASLNDEGAPTETHNYFAVLRDSPRSILPRLVVQKGCADVAVRIAALMGTDVLQEVLQSWLRPVRCPKQAADVGEAMVSPLSLPPAVSLPTPEPGSEAGELSSQLSLEVLRPLAAQSRIRAALGAVFWLVQNNSEEGPEKDCVDNEAHALDGSREEEEDVADFAREIAEAHGALLRWMDQAIPPPRSHEAVSLESDQDVLNGLLQSGHLKEALEFASRGKGSGAACKRPPDSLLRETALRATEQHLADPGTKPSRSPALGGWQGDTPRDMAALSWQCVMRMQDKMMASGLVLQLLLHWELKEAVEAASLCASQLRTSSTRDSIADVMMVRMETLAQQLQLYCEILDTDVRAEVSQWQQLHAMFESKRGQVIRRLVASGSPKLAVRVANQVSDKEPLAPAVAQYAQAAYVQALLEVGARGHRPEPLAALRYLNTLGPEEQYAVVERVITAPVSLPHARLLLRFIMKAERITKFSEAIQEKLYWVYSGARVLEVLESEPEWKPWAGRLHHLLPHPELMLEALLMAQQVNAAKGVLLAVPQLHNDDLVRKYALAAVAMQLPPNQDARGDAFVASNGPRRSIGSHEQSSGDIGSAKLPSVDVLQGRSDHDAHVRAEHRYRSSPNVSLFRNLIDLSSGPLASACVCLDAATQLLHESLSEDRCKENTLSQWRDALTGGEPWAIEAALSVVTLAAEILDSAKTKLLAAPADDAMAGVKELTEGRVDALADDVSLLKTILGKRVGCDFEEVNNPERTPALLERLLSAERYQLAIYCAQRRSCDVAACWEKWAFALMSVGDYKQATIKLKEALQLLSAQGPAGTTQSADAAKGSQQAKALVLKAMKAVEETPPADVAECRRLVSAMFKSAQADEDDDAMEIDSFMTVLKIPAKAQPELSRGTEEEEPWGDDGKFHMIAALLEHYAPDEHKPFLFRHDRIAQACRSVLGGEEQSTTDWETDLSDLHQLCQLFVDYAKVPEMISTMLAMGPRGQAALHQTSVWMLETDHVHHLYRCQLALQRHAEAGATACRMFAVCSSLEKGLPLLEAAQKHFKDALSQRVSSQVAGWSSPSSQQRHHGSDRQLDVAKQLALTGLQLDVVAAFKEQDLQNQASSLWTGEAVQPLMTPAQINLFAVPGETGDGIPGALVDEEGVAMGRRELVAEQLLDIDFGLAFRLMHDLRLPFAKVYGRVAGRLARERQHNWLRKLLANVIGTISPRDQTEVVLAAVRGYASIDSIRDGERLLQLLPGTPPKVTALLALGLLQKAFNMAKSDQTTRVASLTLVLQEAQAQNNYHMISVVSAAMSGPASGRR